MRRTLSLRFLVPALTALYLSVLLFALPVQAGAATTVSAGPGCDYATIQAAIDAMSALGATSPEEAVVRVVDNGGAPDAHQIGQALVVDGATLTLEGGFANCAGSAAASPTLVEGTGTASVLTILGGAQVVLRNLEIAKGGGGFGGGIYLRKSVAIVDGLVVRNNKAFAPNQGLGGGIYAWDGSTLLLRDSTLSDNEAHSGGGLFCSTATILGEGGNQFLRNDARHGGGISAQACDVELIGGHEFAENEAKYGGGLRVQEGRLRMRSTSSGSVIIRENRAVNVDEGTDSPEGGGLILNNVDAELVDVAILDNSADVIFERDGGGALMMKGGLVRVTSSGTGCPAPCSLWRGNQSQRGAAAFLQGGRLEILGTRVEGHSHFDGTSRATGLFSSFSGPSELHVESSTITSNSASRLFDMRDGGLVDVADSTLALNDTDVAFEVRTGYHGELGHVGLWNSIVWEFAGTETYLGGAGDFDAECVLSNDPTSQPASAQNWFFAIPGFKSEGAGNFHLRDDSAAIDRCTSAATAHVGRLYHADQDGEARCVDHTSVPGPATCDLGADEVRSFPAGVVFADGFESGGLSRWAD